MDTSFPNTRESIADARRDTTDWAALTRAEQIRSIELDGFVVIPDALPPDKVATLPQHIQPFFLSLNTRHIEYDLPNRPDGMHRDAAGVSPRRRG